MAFTYKSNKYFNVFTNYDTTDYKDVILINTKKIRNIPTLIDNYNHNMHGVDKANRYRFHDSCWLIGYLNMYLPRTKNRGWNRTVFGVIFYIKLSNTFLIWNQIDSTAWWIGERICYSAKNEFDNRSKQERKLQKVQRWREIFIYYLQM